MSSQNLETQFNLQADVNKSSPENKETSPPTQLLPDPNQPMSQSGLNQGVSAAANAANDASRRISHR